MAAAAAEISGLQMQRVELAKIFAANAGEFIEQLRKRFAEQVAFVTTAIERFERARFAVLQNHFYSGNPIGAIAMKQMAYDIEWSEGVFAFVAQSPPFGKIAEQ